jgi:Na+-driven multidrug efflux pump
LFRELLKKGALMLFCEMTWVLSETLTTAIYNGRGGADVVSGMASSFAIANLFFVSFGGIYSATTVIIGKTLGEGNFEKARREKNVAPVRTLIFHFWLKKERWLNNLACEHQSEPRVQEALCSFGRKK